MNHKASRRDIVAALVGALVILGTMTLVHRLLYYVFPRCCDDGPRFLCHLDGLARAAWSWGAGLSGGVVVACIPGRRALGQVLRTSLAAMVALAVLFGLSLSWRRQLLTGESMAWELLLIWPMAGAAGALLHALLSTTTGRARWRGSPRR